MTNRQTSVAPAEASKSEAQNREHGSIEDICFTELGAAVFAKKSARTLQRWRAMRCGPPYVKLGNRVYYPKERLIAWVLSEGAAR